MAAIHPNWDLDQYIQNYSGHGQIHRLKFIAQKSQPLQIDALRLAVRLIKDTTLNVPLYQTTVDQLRQVSPSSLESTLDQAWADQANRSTKQIAEKLEGELKNYKNNLIKESIRMGHMDLAEHYYKCGDYENALKCYTRIRDYCTSPKHLLDQCLDAINVGFQMKNYATVQAYITKAQNAPEGPDKVAISPKLKASSALYSLITGKYTVAATEFLQIGPDLGSTYNEILSANDVAVYGGLCAMAFFDRDDLKSRLLDNSEFKTYLELEPHIREAAQAFYSAKYSITLDILERHRSDFVVDIFLSQHVDLLYTEIRQKALVQAFYPYSTLELSTLSQLFSTPVSDLVVEVVQLIEDGKIKARLDSQKNVLVARQVDRRSKVFQTSLKMATSYQKSAHMHLLNMKLAQAELEVRPPQSKEGKEIA